MGRLGEEVSQKIKSAVRAKLMELGIHMDNELPDYVMVLVANKKSQKQMEQDLQLFLGSSTIIFTTWLHNVLKRLEQVTVSSKGLKKKSEEKKSKSKRHSTDTELGEDDVKNNPPKKMKSQEKTKNQAKEEILMDNETSFEPLQSIKKEPEPITDDENDYVNLRAEMDAEIGGGAENSCEMEISHQPLESEKCVESKDIPPGQIEEAVSHEDKKSSEQKEKAYSEENKDKKSKSSERSKERVKITWDCETKSNDKINNLDGEMQDSNSRSSNKSQDKQRIRRRSSERESHITERSRSLNDIKERSNSERQSRSREQERLQSKSSVREKIQWHANDDSVSKRPIIYDARDIIKQKTNSSKRSLDRKASPERPEKGKEGEHESEKKKKHLSSVSKVVINERVPEKTVEVALPSLVKVTPRPVRRPGIQANCNLILKAVADAEKSVAISKNTCKLKSPERKSRRNEFSVYVPPAKISVTLSNDCVSSSLETQKEQSEMSYKTTDEEQDSIPIITNEDGTSQRLENEAFKPSDSWPQTEASTQLMTSDSTSRANEIEPQFLITLGNYTSDLYNDADLDWEDAELCKKVAGPRQILTDSIETDSNEPERVVSSKQPFNRSRLGPPPVVAAVRPLQKSVTERIAEIDGIAIDMDTTAASKVMQLKAPKRCKYWPNCTAGEKCLFHHPEVVCRAFPNCKYGDQCNYVHPPCKFDDKCLNVNCPYMHTYGVARKAKTPLPLSLPRTEQCVYYPNCTNKLCRYQHPKKFCKFGLKCSNWGCEFDHSQTMLPTKDQLTWTPTKT